MEFDPSIGMLEACERQSELARSLMAILKLGDSNPTSIANSAIALMQKNQSRIRQQAIVRSLAVVDRRATLGVRWPTPRQSIQAMGPRRRARRLDAWRR